MPDNLEKRLERKWLDRIGMAVSVLAISGAMYLGIMAFKPVENKQEAKNDSWVEDYLGRRVPKQAAKYASKASEVLDYLVSDK